MRTNLGHHHFLNLLLIQDEKKNQQSFHPHEWIDLSQYQCLFVHHAHALSENSDDDGKGNGGNYDGSLGHYGGNLGHYDGSFGNGGNLGRRNDD